MALPEHLRSPPAGILPTTLQELSPFLYRIHLIACHPSRLYLG